jgi:PAS domain S-box-containing protein
MKQHKRPMPRTLAERFAALSRVGTALMRQVDEAAVLRLCAQTAFDLTAAAFATVILRPVTEEQEEGEPLVPSEGAHFHLAVVVGATQEQEAFLRRVLLTGEELFAPLFHQGRSVRVADVVPLFSPAEEPLTAASQDATDQAPGDSVQEPPQEEEHSQGLPTGHAVVRSFLGAPLLDDVGQVRGGVLLGHHKSGQFTKEDEILLVSLVAQTALALEKARFARLAQLREQQLRAILDRSADGVTLLDPHGSLGRDYGATRQARERPHDTPEGGQAVAARLQEAEQEARQRASQLEAICEAIPEALLVYDREGHVSWMNAAGQHLYERLGLPDYATAPVADRAVHAAIWEEQGQRLARESFPTARILAGEVLPPARAVEIALRDRQGATVSLSITGGPLRDAQGHLVGAVTIARDTTERKHLEQALQQQAQQYRYQLMLQAELIDLAHDAILVRDPYSRIRSWNRGAEHLYGWTVQEARGCVSYELLQTRFPVSQSVIEAHLEREGQWKGELQHICHDGTEVLVDSRQVLVRDAAGHPSAILEINRDITERRQLEALQQQLQRETEAHLALLQQVVDELPSSVYLVQGPDARLILANRATTTVWRASWARRQPMEEFLRQNGIRVLGPNGKVLPPEQRAIWHALQEGQAISQYQEIIRQPDGKTLPVLVNVVPLTLSPLFLWPEESVRLDTEGTQPVALVVHQDMSVLKEAERLKDEFIALAAHELRTPLAVLNGAAQTLHFQQQQGRGPPLAEWQHEALSTIAEATQQLVRLSDVLLDVTRLQAGRLEIHPEPTDLVALSRRVTRSLQRTTQQQRLSLHTSQDSLVVALDPGRIEQVLTNLISNAIKYSPQGGPIEVSVWAEHETGEIVLSVRDEGIGIPAQQQAAIFGRFVRATNARTIVGTGLGLYLCRALVELHGGRLWFESVEGQGSTFFLALPIGGETVPLE